MLASLLSSVSLLLFSNVHALFTETIKKVKAETETSMRVPPQLHAPFDKFVVKKSQLIRQLNQEQKKLTSLQDKLLKSPIHRKPSITKEISKTEQRITTLKKQIAAIKR